MKKIYIAISVLVFTISVNGQTVSLDASFGNNGIVQTGFGHYVPSNYLHPHQVLLHPDGSIYFVIQVNAQGYLVRRRQDGSLDLNYGENGYSYPSWISNGTAVLLADGRIVIGGRNTAAGFQDYEFGIACYRPDGRLDSSFGTNGMQTTSFGGNASHLTALAVQQDGKIVAVGSTNNDFAIARYLPDGSPDISFAGDGKDTVDFASPVDATFVAIMHDGRIMVVGSGASIYVVRYLPNGNPDHSFSGDGRTTLDFPESRSARAMKLQPDGKLVIVGERTANGNRDISVIRLLTDGTLDNSFSTDGIQTITFGWNTTANSVDLDITGRIIIGAHSYNGEFCVVRLNTDGTLDNSFSGDGKVNTTLLTGSAYIRSVAVQPDQKIIAAGSPELYKYAAVRYNVDGSLDPSFEDDGIMIDFKPSSATIYIASAVQPDGKLVTVGETYVTTQSTDISVARYNVNGTLDSSFSGDGKLLLKFGPGRNNASDMAIQNDGKIVIGGISRPRMYDGDFAIARLHPDGSFDNSFSGDGIVVKDLGSPFEQLKTICIQPDGKIILAGSSDTGMQYRQNFTLLRFHSDGTLDDSFSEDGIMMTQLLTRNEGVNKILLQPDGRIIAVGTAYLETQVTGSDIVVARFLPDGSPDLSFNGTGVAVTSVNALDVCYSAALDASGRIVISGFSGTGDGGQGLLLRYLSNGLPDNSFSGDGISMYSNPGAMNSVTTQPGGYIIAGGTGNLSFNGNPVIVRFRPDGTPDTSFGVNGKIENDFGNWESINSINLFHNRIYGVGSSSYDGSTGFVIAYVMRCTMTANIPDAMTLESGVDKNTVYIGYTPASDLSLHVQPTGGTAPYSYLWSNGATSPSINIMPLAAQTLSVTVTDSRGCLATANKFVNVMDVRCGTKRDKVQICIVPRGNPDNANTACLSEPAIAAHLKNGSYLGPCKSSLTTLTNRAEIPNESANRTSLLEVYPNPSNSQFSIVPRFSGIELIHVVVYDNLGRMVEKKTVSANQTFTVGGNYRPGVYWVECTDGSVKKRVKVVKVQ